MACDTISSAESSNLSLARRLAAGSSAAWTDLVELYGPLLDRWCRVAGIPHEAIPDIAQETFLAVFRGIEQFDPNHEAATFRGWLWTVARNRIRDFYRRNGHLERGAGGQTPAEVDRLVAPGLDEEPSEQTDIIALTRWALTRIEAEFEPKTWRIFLDCVLLDHPTGLIAERYGVSTATVRQAKSRVLRRLRQTLGDQ